MIKNKQEADIICAIDIGTSKIAAFIARVHEDKNLEILGLGVQKSNGLKRGVIVNIDSTVKSIQKAVDEAEQMSGFEMSSAYVGIAGAHIESFDSHGIAPIANKEVTKEDIANVIASAKAVPISADKEIIHVLYQDFIVDNQKGIKEPLGMSGVRLEAKVHIVTASNIAIRNIEKCVNQCGIKLAGIVLEQLASSYAVLNEDEKELGTCLIDIGAGTTDVAVIKDGVVIYSEVLNIAGNSITSDVAYALHVGVDKAERIKIEYGCAYPNIVKSDEVIAIPTSGSRNIRKMSAQTLSEYIEARVEEIYIEVLDSLKKNNLLDQITSEIVLTGGAAKMRGMVALAEEIFALPVRIGGPIKVTGVSDVLHNPIHATGVGLLIYGIKQRQNGQEVNQSRSNLINKVRNWFGKYF